MTICVADYTREPVLLEICQREGEGVVDADDGRDVAVKFDAEPFGEATSSPIPAWARRRRNRFWITRACRNIDANALAT
jgi:hypothetical protein